MSCMVELTRGHEANEETSGKNVHHVARYEQSRPVGPDKSVIDVVGDDFRVYRFERLRPGERYTFAPGTGRDNRIQRTGRLPEAVEAVIDSEADDEGWYY